MYGTILKMSTWGESHGYGVGVTVDGMPAGIPLDEEKIQEYLDRRKPGQSKYTTPRSESDKVTIMSGVFNGKTTGTPIAMMVKNETQRSADYSEIATYYRPGHADYTFDEKYGFRDYRGGGRSSGRETIARVAAGAIAAILLNELGITVQAYAKSIGEISISTERFQIEEAKKNAFGLPDKVAAVEAEEYVSKVMKEQDSLGGVIECVVNGLSAGIGEPVFEKLDANLAKAILSIGAVKGFEMGDGIEASKKKGSWNNDGFYRDSDGNVRKETNHSGGTLGGISDGSQIVLRAYVKPTPSIFKEQKTVNQNGENITIQIKGRHDPLIVPRGIVVVECMTAFTVADMMLLSMTSNMERIKKFFKQ